MLDSFPTAKDFLMQFQAYAKAVEVKYGIPWLLTATQAAHESSNGNSGLAKHNNLFGVTGDGTLLKAGVHESMSMIDVKSWLLVHPEVQVVIMKTNEQSPYPPEKIKYWSRPGDIISKTPHGTGSDVLAERPFRTYASWTESLQDWVDRIIRLYPRAYAAAHMNDAAGFFEGLQAGGYATDTKYAAQLKVRYSQMEALV